MNFDELGRRIGMKQRDKFLDLCIKHVSQDLTKRELTYVECVKMYIGNDAMRLEGINNLFGDLN